MLNVARRARERREPAAAVVRRARVRLWLVLGLSTLLAGGAALTRSAAVFAAAVVVGFAAAVVAASLARREVVAALVEPLEQLAESARRLAGGEINAPVPRQGSAEVLQAAGELAMLAKALDGERRARLQEAGHVERRAGTVRQLLALTQGLGSSLQIEHVLEETANAARTIGGHAAAVIWFPDEFDGRLMPVWDSRTAGRPADVAPIEPGVGLVGRAASLGQIITIPGDGRPDQLAVPIVRGLTTLGVIELISGRDTHANRADDLDALEVLARHSATAIEASRLHGEMERRSETDGLTRVFNRRRLDNDLRFEVARATRYQRPLALIMVDLDHFKEVNDTFGHQTGDEVLKVVGATLLRECRTTDGAYRFGGEEFAVLLRDTDAAAAEAVADRFRVRITEGLRILGLPRPVTASLGVSAVGNRVKTMERLIEQADVALYEAKSAGRNRVVLAAPG